MREAIEASSSGLCFTDNDETPQGQKNKLRLGPQQFVVQFTNGLQLALKPLIISQPLLHLGLVFRSNGELARSSAGITHRKNPNSVALAPSALQAALAMENLAVEE